MYPNKYFNLNQWAADADDSPLGRMPYQYGVGTRSIAMIRHPAAAAFSAVIPFDFVRLRDGNGGYWDFVYRPDLALGVNIVANRTVGFGILGATAIQVNQAFINAVALVNPIGNPASNTARLMMLAQGHSPPIDNQVTLTVFNTGVRGQLDATGITAVAGYAFSGFTPPTGPNVVGRTRAVGAISPVAGASLIDGELFTITAPNLAVPGALISINFEFDSGGAVAPGNVLIPFTALDTIDTVGTTIAARINSLLVPPDGPGPLYGLTAVYSSFLATVFLTADIAGAIGGSLFNFQAITETVANASFVVAGMGGGQDGSILAPLLWGPKRGAVPLSYGFEREGVE